MKPEKQRIAIAKACGWTWTNKCPEHGKQTIKFWLNEHTGRKVYYDSSLPDYLNDLNAMHEAEKTFQDNATLWHKYASIINKDYVNQPYTIGATAAQRAEAFLRTVGRWEE